MHLLHPATAPLLLTFALVGCESGSDGVGDTQGAPTTTTGSDSDTATAQSDQTGSEQTGSGDTGNGVTGVAGSSETGSSEAGGESGTAETGTGPLTPCAGIEMFRCPVAPGAIPTDLAQALLDGNAAVALDVRGMTNYAAGHIPGAFVLDASALRATVDGIGGQVTPPEETQAVFEAAGLAPDQPLVVYGATNDTSAARVVWTLAYYGHDAEVWMLDGGYAQWTAEGRDDEVGAADADASSYTIGAPGELRVDATWVLDRLDDPTVTLVDARSQAEYDDGHIPGALAVDWVTNLDANGLFLGPADLLDLYGTPEASQTLIVYCQTGSRASVDWLVLAMLGYGDVRIYDGSWSEWGSDPRLPRE